MLIGALCSSMTYAQEPILMDSVTVKENKNVPFRVSHTRSATLVETPVEELPIVVDSLPQEIIEARGSGSLAEIMQMQSGISTDGQSLLSRTSGQYTIRGRSGSEVSLDGLTIPSGMGLLLDASSIERVDIVKGPAGGISGGQTSTSGAYGAGGSVNLILKEPTFKNEGSVGESVRFGEGSRYRTDIDANFVNKEKTVGVRVAGGLTWERPFWAYNAVKMGETFSLSPSIQWRPKEDFIITLKTSFQYLDTPGYQGVPVLAGHLLGDYDAYYGGTSSRDLCKGALAQLVAEKKLNDTWTLRMGTGFGVTNLDWTHFYVSSNARGMAGYDNLINQGKGVFGYGWNETTNVNYNGFVQGIASFYTEEVKHDLLTALDYSQKRTTGYSSFGSTKQVLDINNRTEPLPLDKIYNDSTSSFMDLYKIGLTVQDQLSWKAWRLLLGGRTDTHISTDNNTSQTFSPRAGLTYLFTPEIISFANFSETNAPNFGYRGYDGEELTNRWTATQYEYGMRYSPKKDLWLSSSFFYIDQTGTPESINNTDRYDSNGSSISKGIEFSVNGAITPAWSTFLSYSWLWYKDVDDNMKFNRFPAHSVSLWQYYKVQEGMLKDVRVGVGYRYASSFFITERGNKVAESYTLPSYALVDATIEIPLPASKYYEEAVIKLGLYNVFDKRYYSTSRGPTQCFPGMPRTGEVAIKMMF